MSAPPDSRANQNAANKMSGQPNHQEQQQPQSAEANVRHIPIFVEGRDEPVINKNVDHGAHFGETKPTYAPPPPQPQAYQHPHIDRDQYFADDGPVGFHHPPNFSRAFGTPFNKGFRQGPQPFVQQKAYPQAAFARGASPQRSQSPKPQTHPDEHYMKVPMYHEQSTPKAEPPKQQQKPSPQQHQPPPPQRSPPMQRSPPKQQTPPPQPKQQTPVNDPITQILAIQTDVLNLMSEVENFTGSKKDKRYLFLDEMLTRNLIKLDNIETDGKENIRQARKEAIRCIQKCIAVLEAKAEKGGSTPQPQTQDIEMENKANENSSEKKEKAIENGEVEMNDETKNATVESQSAENPQSTQPQEKKEEDKKEEPKKEEKIQEKREEVAQAQENKEAAQPQVVDTRPEVKAPEENEVKHDEQKTESGEKKCPKKGTKTVKKRDKSKDKKDASKDSNKDEKVDEKKEDKKIEAMQVDNKGDKTELQSMEVDGASPSQ